MTSRVKHPAGKKKYLYFILALVTFLTILSMGLDVKQNSPGFCSSCHTMKPEYYTWRSSSHSKLDCLECHQAEGVKGVLSLSSDLVRMTYAEITKSYIRPIRLFRSIDDQVCFRCHSYNRKASPKGDLIIPHEAHSDRSVRCISCHSAVAHGDIARRAITRSIDYSAWDMDEGVQQMAGELARPSMENCMSCHYRRRVATSCETCHTGMSGPDNHLLADFGVNHGTFARDGLQDCNSCHGYSGEKKLQFTEKTSLAQYTRENRFCLSCHRTRPPSHENSIFRKTHGLGLQYEDREKDGCLVCHDNNRSELPRVTEVSCAQCHPSKHGTNWRSGHLPALALQDGISNTCFRCHSSDTCLGCHYLPGSSTGGWRGAPPLDIFEPLPPPISS
ncbi:MAG: NapC/NirT family cytochrome c [Dethiobacter sp.]|nr:NapC/NirT family cytochrome c [Dethiobacter sp.]